MKSRSIFFLSLTLFLCGHFSSAYSVCSGVQRLIEIDQEIEVLKEKQTQEWERGKNKNHNLLPYHNPEFCKEQITTGMDLLTGKTSRISQNYATKEERIHVLNTISNMVLANRTHLYDKFSHIDLDEKNPLFRHHMSLFVMFVGVRTLAEFPLISQSYENFLENGAFIYEIIKSFLYVIPIRSYIKEYLEPKILRILFPEEFFLGLYKRAFEYPEYPQGFANCLDDTSLCVTLAVKGINPEKSQGFKADVTFKKETIAYDILKITRSDREDWTCYCVNKEKKYFQDYRQVSNLFEPKNPFTEMKTAPFIPITLFKEKKEMFSTDGRNIFLKLFVERNPFERLLALDLRKEYPDFEDAESMIYPFGWEETLESHEEENWGLLDALNKRNFNIFRRFSDQISYFNPHAVAQYKLDYFHTYLECFKDKSGNFYEPTETPSYHVFRLFHLLLENMEEPFNALEKIIRGFVPSFIHLSKEQQQGLIQNLIHWVELCPEEKKHVEYIISFIQRREEFDFMQFLFYVSRQQINHPQEKIVAAIQELFPDFDINKQNSLLEKSLKWLSMTADERSKVQDLFDRH